MTLPLVCAFWSSTCGELTDSQYSSCSFLCFTAAQCKTYKSIWVTHLHSRSSQPLLSSNLDVVGKKGGPIGQEQEDKGGCTSLPRVLMLSSDWLERTQTARIKPDTQLSVRLKPLQLHLGSSKPTGIHSHHHVVLLKDYSDLLSSQLSLGVFPKDKQRRLTLFPSAC